MTADFTDDHPDTWVGSVIRSPLDARVWVAVLPDVDTVEGAMHASTSARRCKRHVETQAGHYGVPVTRWVRDAGGDWQAHCEETD